MNDKNWRRFRIFNIWLNGKIPLAKKMKKVRMEIRKEKCREFLKRIVVMTPDELALEKERIKTRIRKLMTKP